VLLSASRRPRWLLRQFASSVRELAHVDSARALFATLEEAARAETWARGIAEDASLADDEEQLEAVFEAVADEGFDRAAVTNARGKQGATPGCGPSCCSQRVTSTVRLLRAAGRRFLAAAGAPAR